MFTKHLYYLIGLPLFFTALPAHVAALNSDHVSDEQGISKIMVDSEKGYVQKTARLIQEDAIELIFSSIVGAFCGGGIAYWWDQTLTWKYMLIGGILGGITFSICYLFYLSYTKVLATPPQGVPLIKEGDIDGGLKTGYLATILDLIVLLLLLFFGYRGFTKGLFSQFFSTAATLFFLIFAKRLSYLMSKVSATLWPGLDEHALPFATIGSLLVVGICFFYLSEKLFKHLLEETFVGYFDSLLGGLLGIVQASFCISTLIWLLGVYDIHLPDEYTKNMRVYQAVAMLVPKCVGVLKTYLPSQVTFLIPDRAAQQQRGS